MSDLTIALLLAAVWAHIAGTVTASITWHEQHGYLLNRAIVRGLLWPVDLTRLAVRFLVPFFRELPGNLSTIVRDMLRGK